MKAGPGSTIMATPMHSTVNPADRDRDPLDPLERKGHAVPAVSSETDPFEPARDGRSSRMRRIAATPVPLRSARAASSSTMCRASVSGSSRCIMCPTPGTVTMRRFRYSEWK